MAQPNILVKIKQLQDADEKVKEMLSKLGRFDNLMAEAERRSKQEKEEAEAWVAVFVELRRQVGSWLNTIALYTRPKVENADPDHEEEDSTSSDSDEDDGDDEKEDAEDRVVLGSSLWLLWDKLRWLINPRIFSCFRQRRIIDLPLHTKLLSSSLDQHLEMAIGSRFFTTTGIGNSNAGDPTISSNTAVPLLPTMGQTMNAGPTLRRIITAGENPTVDDGGQDLHNLLQAVIPDQRRGSNNNTNIGVKVISISGEWGAERTTLAERLYNHVKVDENFDVRRWITVPFHYDPEKLANDLLGGSQFESIEDAHRVSWEWLLQMIEEFFYMKSFLLVLDKVDTCDSRLRKLLNSFKHGSPGSIILVIISSPYEAQNLQGASMYRPLVMSPEQGWSILRDMLSLSGKSNLLSGEFEEVGRRIIQKCEGVLFNLKIIGTHLQLKDTVQEWNEVLNSNVWEMEEAKAHGYCPIYIIYKDLPLPLQHCFLYVAIFDFDAVIDIEQLIRLWMAEGYLGPPSERDDRRRRKGLDYFNQLVHRSLFYNFVKSSVHRDKIISCQMDTRLHLFARWLVRRKLAVPPSFDIGSCFITFYHSMVHPRYEWLGSNHITALNLSSSRVRKLPREIRNLMLLQYLNLSGNPIKRLPETICDLQYLEFLDVHLCYMLLKLPQGIRKLQRLRHLRIDHTTEELSKLPPGFEELTLVCTLDVFRAGGKYNKISMLKDFHYLEELCVVIHSKVILEQAKLRNKTQMQSLELCFVGEGRDPEVVKLVEAWVPPPYLELLKLEGYQGVQLPQWIVERSFINNLRRLTVKSALKLLSLPALRILSSLEFLWLDEIPILKHLGRDFLGLPDHKVQNEHKWIGSNESVKGIEAFPKLKTFRIECLDSLDTWEDLNEDDEKIVHRISVMPHLEELIIRGCSKLKVLPHRILARIPSLKVSIDGK
ncbi:OLC1v1000407C1 [Oldenlandia corymbosa var. corymbosa]|uniref:OLC1v1000407C1 n=1 Tax=Oldenlandia corymbosa var. corymbosa TaxID=529605 RepID=A0AAV1D3S1_OLDCO|nr:OLC1v1000407C1 [Oldenlandia corymbosa var. corymbosa]